MPGSITPLLRRANPAGRRPPRARARRAVLSAAMVLGFVGVTSATAAAEDAANSDGGAASADVSAADVAAGPNLGPVDPAWLRPPVPGPEVVLYEHGSFGGRAQGFAPGAYDATLGEFGALVNDEVSSLRVPAGRQAVLCEHVGADAGRCLWYRQASTPSFGGSTTWPRSSSSRRRPTGLGLPCIRDVTREAPA